jgi:hypothetical protein
VDNVPTTGLINGALGGFGNFSIFVVQLCMVLVLLITI